MNEGRWTPHYDSGLKANGGLRVLRMSYMRIETERTDRTWTKMKDWEQWEDRQG
jgi:hypothetical protein